jgi:hypothetical protein
MMAGTPPDNFILPLTKRSSAALDNEFPRLHVLKSNNQISWLHTILRDVTTSHGDFVFNADRLVCACFCHLFVTVLIVFCGSFGKLLRNY